MREDELSIRIPPGPRLGDLVVQATGLSMGFGDKLLFENVNFDLPRGGIVVLSEVTEQARQRSSTYDR